MNDMNTNTTDVTLVMLYCSVSIDVSLLACLWFFHVGLPIEVCKEQEEHCAVEEDDIAEDFREVTGNEER